MSKETYTSVKREINLGKEDQGVVMMKVSLAIVEHFDHRVCLMFVRERESEREREWMRVSERERERKRESGVCLQAPHMLTPSVSDTCGGGGGVETLMPHLTDPNTHTHTHTHTQ